jgi:uncharacterized membrane protein
VGTQTVQAQAVRPLTVALGLAVLVVAVGLAPDVARAAGGSPTTKAVAEAKAKKAAAGLHAALYKGTLNIFKEACAKCHDEKTFKAEDPGKSFPKKNKFGNILDLAALRDSKYIVRGNPDKSELFEQIHTDEMPPPDEDLEPLDEMQKLTVRKWIEADCPVPASSATTTTAPAREARPFITRLIQFVGKFHPLAAHTPIALMMAAAIAEILYLRHPAPALTGAARFCVVLGALGAVATAALGWALANSIKPSDGLELHRWTGTIAGCVAIPLAILGEWAARRAHRDGHKWHGFSRWVYRLSVFAVAGMIGFTAHLGGILVWGVDVLDFPQI